MNIDRIPKVWRSIPLCWVFASRWSLLREIRELSKRLLAAECALHDARIQLEQECARRHPFVEPWIGDCQ